MKNIDLYYRINIFLGLYYNRTQLDDLGAFLGSADMLIFNPKQPNIPVKKITRMVDVSIWNDWLKVIGLEQHIPLEEEWQSHKIDIKAYIKKTGDLPIGENLQLDLMYKFLSSQKLEFKWEWDKLFDDITNNVKTQKEWEKSLEILQTLVRD